MTKIGEGKGVPEEDPVQKAHKDIEYNALRFLNALESFKGSNYEDRARLKGVMDDSMKMIRGAVSEIRQSGIYNQEVKVEKDYKAFIQSSTPENSSALEEDIGLLRDFNRLG